MNFLKDLKPGQTFRFPGEATLYRAVRAYTDGGRTTVVYRVNGDGPGGQYMFTKPALTSVIFGA